MDHFGLSYLNSPRLAFPTPTHLLSLPFGKAIPLRCFSRCWPLGHRGSATHGGFTPPVGVAGLGSSFHTAYHSVFEPREGGMISGPFGKPPVAAALSPDFISSSRTKKEWFAPESCVVSHSEVQDRSCTISWKGGRECFCWSFWRWCGLTIFWTDTP